MKNAKRLACMLLAACVLFTGMFANGGVFIAHAQLDEPRELVNLDFENETTGQVPSGWQINSTIVGQPPAAYFCDYVTEFTSGASAKVYEWRNWKQGTYTRRYALGEAVSNAVLEYDVYLLPVTATTGALLPTLLYANTGSAADERLTTPLQLYVQGANTSDPFLSFSYGKSAYDSVKTLKWNTWYTIKVEMDLPSDTLKVYVNGDEVTLAAANAYNIRSTATGAKLDRISTGADNQGYSNFYLDNIRVTTTAEKTVAPAAQETLVDLDFENSSLAGWTDNPATPYSGLLQSDREQYISHTVSQNPVTESKALYISHYSTESKNYLRQYALGCGVDNAVLEYDFNLSQWSAGHQATYLPVLLYQGTTDNATDFDNAPLGLYVQCDGSPRIYYNYGRGIERAKVSVATLAWSTTYHVRIEYDLPNKSVKVYLNGTQLTLPTTSLEAGKDSSSIVADGKLDRISAGAYGKLLTRTYIDNIQLTTKATVTFAQSTYYMNYGQTLALNPTIVGGACQIDYQSSNPNVARVENGVLRAVGTGIATITATPSFDSVAPIQLKVLVSGTTITKLDFESDGVQGWYDNPATPLNGIADTTNISFTTKPDPDTSRPGNTALEFKCYSTTNQYMRQFSLGKAVNKAVLEYQFYLNKWSHSHQGTYLPVLLYANGANAVGDQGVAPFQLFVQAPGDQPTLYYNYGQTIASGKPAIATVDWYEWNTIRLEYDLPNRSVKVFLNGTQLTLPTAGLINATSANINAGASLDRISVGGYLGLLSWTYFDDIKVVDTTSNLPVSLDFEQETVGQQPTGWTIHPVTSGTTAESHYLKVEQDTLDPSNQIVRMYQDYRLNSSHSYFMRYGFEETEVAVLSYRFMLNSKSIGSYLPSLVYTGVDNNEEYRGSPLLLFVSNTNTVSWGYSDSRWATAADNLQWNTWHKVVMMVDLRNNQRKLFIDEKEVDLTNTTSTDPYPDKTGMTISRVSAGFYSGMGERSFCFDNLQVLSGMDAASVSFGSNSFMVRQNDKLTLKPKFLPLGSDSCRLTYTSADPSVVTVDANGVLTGHKVGATTVTVTASAKNIAPVTLKITVDDRMTGNFTDVPSALDLPLHGHVVLDPTLTLIDEGDNSLEIISEDPDVVTVDQWNEVLAIGAGQTNLVIRSVQYPWIQVEIPVTVAAASVMRTIYVSPNGTGDGSAPSAPTSLDGAVTILAGINKAQMTGNVEVVLSEGYYYRTETLALNETHGGNNLYSVVFKAAESADVTIGGAMHIAGSAFTKGSNGIYVADIPEGVATRQMYVNNIRATRATSTGPLSNAAFLYEGSVNVGITCTNTELLNCTNPDGLEIVNAQYWGHRRVGVSQIRDGGNGTVQLIMDQPAWAEALTGNTNTDFTIARIKSYENALVLLDQPGEWYLDEVNNKLYYMPRAYEDMSDVTVTLALLDSWDQASDGDNGLVSVQGTDYDHPVQNITFQGITFADTTYMRPSSQYGHKASEGNHLHDEDETNGYKSADSVIAVKKANGIHFMDCDFTRLGTTGVKFQNGAKNSRLIGNRFYDLSGGAILIGEPEFGNTSSNINRYPSDVKYLTKNIDIQNNYIHHIGLEFQSACGIYVGFIPDVDIIHNEIYATAYSGTYVGAGWNAPTQNLLQNLTFANNYVHDHMYMGTCDGGGFYSCGNTMGNNNILENFIQNQGNCVGAIYFDSGATNWNAQYNVVDVSKTTEASNCHRPIDWGYAAESANNLTISNNFYKDADALYYGFNGYYLTMENNTQVAVNSAWPTAAQQIINKSGVEAAYADSRHHMAVQVTSNLQEGATIPLNATNYTFQVVAYGTDGRGRTVDVSGAMRFVIEDKSIVSVSDTGLITALKAGTTYVKLYIVSCGIEFALERVRVVVSSVPAAGAANSNGNTSGNVNSGTQILVQPDGTALPGTSAPSAGTQDTGSGLPSTEGSTEQFDALIPNGEILDMNSTTSTAPQEQLPFVELGNAGTLLEGGVAVDSPLVSVDPSTENQPHLLLFAGLVLAAGGGVLLMIRNKKKHTEG